MNLVVDFGNTAIKAATFKGNEISSSNAFESEYSFNEWVVSKNFDSAICASVTQSHHSFMKMFPQCMLLSYKTSLPVNNSYRSPQTLGTDRIAGAVGAKLMFPENPCLVIDIGTCINYEFVDANNDYIGGAISPGVSLRFKSMNNFTSALPLVDVVKQVKLTGTSTEECLQTGVMQGIVNEIQGTIDAYQSKYKGVKIIITGGDAHLFESKIKGSIFVVPNLVLKGLNDILNYNAEKF